jgi:hypothetical protein
MITLTIILLLILIPASRRILVGGMGRVCRLRRP